MLNWSTKKLGEICEIIAGQAPPSDFYNKEGKGIPFLRVNSFGEIYPKVDSWTTKPLKLSRSSDVLLSVAGSVGFVNLGINACITRSIFALRPNKEILQKLLFYILKSKSKMLSEIGQGSAQRIITRKQIESFKIPLPPLPEQRKIVYVLDSIQDAIRAQEKIIEKTKELNKSMMADLFKYGGPSFRKGRKLKKTEIGEIPENWEVVTIKNIGEVVTGTTPSTLVKDYWNGDIPFVTPTDITKKYVENTERYISQKGLQKARLLPKDSILVTCIASIGKISITPKPCISNQQINAIICKENIDNEYIYYVMNHMSDRLKMWAGQTTSPIVKKSLFEKFILPLPKDKNEQREIAEILQTIDQKIEIEQKKKALYEELFRTMLNKLMTGEIRVDNLKL